MGLPITLVLAACWAALLQPERGSSDDLEGSARQELARFLDYLHDGNYSEAAGLYGGSYENLQFFNPQIDAREQAALLKNACTINGYQCLQADQIELVIQSESEFIYNVQFLNTDGSLFHAGSCCELRGRQSKFKFRVALQPEDDFLVMDLPPYQP
jgi:hypothetical protein